MIDAMSVARGIVGYCIDKWPQDEVLIAFESMAEGVTPLANDGPVTAVRHIIEGVLLEGACDWSDHESDTRAGLIAACLSEAQRRTAPTEIRLQEGAAVLSRHTTALSALKATEGRNVNELEWDGNDLIIWVAPQCVTETAGEGERT